MSDVPALVADLVARTLATRSGPAQWAWYDIAKALGSAPEFETVSGACYRHHEYQIHVGGASVAAALARVAPLGLAIAPEIVTTVPAGPGLDVLITRYRACAGERLTSVGDMKQPLRAEAVERLRSDMETLLAHGLVHTFARSTRHWLMSSERGTLVLDNWESLQPCIPGNGASMLSHIDGLAAHHQAQFVDPPARPDRRQHRVQQIFGAERVLLPVIHPVSWDAALASVALVVDVGCPGIFLIDQGMPRAQVLELVLAVRERFPALWVGVNLLGLAPAAALTAALDACDGRMDGLWTDNAGVDERAASQPAAEALLDVRRARGWNGLYFGGVAFKHQREVPDADLSRAARAATAFMDLVCTSGPGTGREARVDKLRAMREGVGAEGAIALASGVTADNARVYAPYVNAFLVGTGIEASFGVLDRQKVATLQRLISRA